MNDFFTRLYASPYGRLFRRFWLAGSAAVLSFFLSKTGLDPVAFIDKTLALNRGDWLFMLKLFIGAGIIAGLDKLRRELPNITSGASPDSER